MGIMSPFPIVPIESQGCVTLAAEGGKFHVRLSCPETGEREAFAYRNLSEARCGFAALVAHDRRRQAGWLHRELAEVMP